MLPRLADPLAPSRIFATRERRGEGIPPEQKTVSAPPASITDLYIYIYIYWQAHQILRNMVHGGMIALGELRVQRFGHCHCGARLHCDLFKAPAAPQSGSPRKLLSVPDA